MGHIKRVMNLLVLLYERFSPKVQTHIFVDTDKLCYFPKLLKKIKDTKQEIKFLNTFSSPHNYEEEFIIKYKAYLKDADIFWSDNLSFPLKYRKEIFLTGSFLWADILIDQESVKKEEELLQRTQPTMIASKYFATPRLRKLTQFKEVGIYEYFPPEINSRFLKKILVGCGKSETANIYFRKYLNAIKKELFQVDSAIDIFFDPDYIEDFNGLKNVTKANYSESMFSEVSAAAIWPGLGTVCDVLTKGGRIFAFFEKDNFEMKHNAQVLQSLNLGEICPSPQAALLRAFDYLSDKTQQKKHLKQIQKLDFTGLEETVNHIHKILN